MPVSIMCCGLSPVLTYYVLQSVVCPDLSSNLASAVCVCTTPLHTHAQLSNSKHISFLSQVAKFEDRFQNKGFQIPGME